MSDPVLAPDELRALVREVLRDALPSALGRAADRSPATEHGAHEPQSRSVSVASDDELAALVQAVARECEDPEQRARLAGGVVQFRLVTSAGGPADKRSSDVRDEPVLRVDRGAVTERHIREAARSGARVVAARGVVVTPLAKDRARSSGVDIEKEY